MATELLATGITAANSTDLTVSAGLPVTVALKGMTDALAEVDIAIKDDAAGYQVVGELNAFQPIVSIVSPGTYRFQRKAGGVCGVFSG